jgi:hypothetical protein
VLTVVIAGPLLAQEGARKPVASTLDEAAARASLDKALQWFVSTQNANGSWASGVIEGLIDSQYSVASYYDWQLAANALGSLALLRSPETKARRAALDKSLRWLTSTRLPKRGSDWDNDTIWAALYGTVTCVAAVQDPRFKDEAWHKPLTRRGKEFLGILLRNQVPTGGWGYYDDPPYSRRPKWGTSFSTALVLPAIKQAQGMKWFQDPKVLRRALAYVRRCRLPNGAYEYDLNPIPRAPSGEHINKVKGSLGRIQVCNWALRACGEASVTDERIRTGLEAFFEHHRFLDVARMRPVPHEAYYANAGYFYFFGHVYAGLVIGLLPEKERESWHARLRAQIVKTQRKDGSFCDFLGQGYLVVAGTAFASIALSAGLPTER